MALPTGKRNIKGVKILEPHLEAPNNYCIMWLQAIVPTFPLLPSLSAQNEEPRVSRVA